MELGPNNTAARGQGQALSDSHDFLCSSNTPLTLRESLTFRSISRLSRLQAVSYSFLDCVILSINISCVNE